MIFDLPWCRSKPPLETPTTHCSASQSSYETPPGTPRAGPAPAPPSSDGGKPQPGANPSLNTSWTALCSGDSHTAVLRMQRRT